MLLLLIFLVSLGVVEGGDNETDNNGWRPRFFKNGRSVHDGSLMALLSEGGAYYRKRSDVNEATQEAHSVTGLVAILMSASIARGRPSAETTLWSKSDVSTQHAKVSLQATDTSEEVTRHVTGDATQGTAGRGSEEMRNSAGPKRNPSFPGPSKHVDTFQVSHRFVSDGKIANADKNTSQAATVVLNTIPLVTRRYNCGVALCNMGNGTFVMNASACTRHSSSWIKTYQSFTVFLLTKQVKSPVIKCVLKIASQENHYINFTVRQLSRDVSGEGTLWVKWNDHLRDIDRKERLDINRLKWGTFSALNLKLFEVIFSSEKPHFTEDLVLRGEIMEERYLHDLPVFRITDTIGYLTSPGFGKNEKYPINYDGVFYLIIKRNYSALINFIKFTTDGFWRTDILLIRSLDTRDLVKLYSWHGDIMVYVSHESLRISFHTFEIGSGQGFKMMFAIIPSSDVPQELPGGLYNCSSPSFHSFRPVFTCNSVTECDGGEDLPDCAQHNSDCGPENTVNMGAKCYSLIINQNDLTWFDAQKHCVRHGQTFAVLEDPDDFRHFKAQAHPLEGFRGYFVGAQLRDRLQAVPIAAMYRNIWRWVDGRTVFSVLIYEHNNFKGSCAMFSPRTEKVVSVPCHRRMRTPALACEFNKREVDRNTTLGDLDSHGFVNLSTVVWPVSVAQCSLNHVTRDFLFCDFQADCDVKNLVTSCKTGDVTVPMFVCQRSGSSVHYTLVCDHLQHCPDNSDEMFCKYPQCSSTSTRCNNGQCIQWYQQCDSKLDCYDGSDEVCSVKMYSIKTTSPPGVIYLDGIGNFRLNRMKDFGECPPTHFQCPRGFCLPVYLRCNGIDDCVGREDEAGCDSFRCRGFYRCRGSRVCLHADNVCDGVPQCPEQDDEMVCDLVCPGECRCRGMAFVCTFSFSASSHVALRYLDASGSNMMISDVRDNIHLIALRLSKCSIVNLIPNMTFPNLRELDLSWNKFSRIRMEQLYPLKNLRVLVLTGNPLIKITNPELPASVSLTLERVDLSHTSLQTFSGAEFSSSPHIKVLNVSWSNLRSMAEDSLQITPRLESLDLRGFRLTKVPRNLLRRLLFLKVVHADHYKLCCEAILPIHFDPKNCHTSRDLLASCDDLLMSNAYRVCLWIFVSLSLAGNVFSVGARLYQQREGNALGSFGVFVTNLSVADILMGIYLAIIGSADFVYRGRYLWHDNEWTKSASCHMAGFLCLLSSETSAFIICLITLDRFLVIQFPFSRLHFGRRSALAASGAVWAVGLSLAVVPLLPATSHWEFYSRTGICIPLPFTVRNLFRGYDYSFGVSILLNLVLFLLIAVGQAFVYRAGRANSLPSSTNTQARDAAIARRLITVVVSDFLCWFPIGLLGLLAATGTPIPGDLNVAVATFVLPVNSALNPFLYTFNLVMEKRRKAQYEQLLKRLELERRDQTTAKGGKSRKSPESVDKTVIIQQIKGWIGDCVLTPKDLLSLSPQQ